MVGHNNLTPFLYVLVALFVFGILINVAIGSLVNPSVPNPNSNFSSSGLYNYLIDTFSGNFLSTFDSGVSIFGFGLFVPQINPFAISIEAQTFMVNQLVILTYIPSFITIPFLIIFIITLFWASVKLIFP